ncbi:major capsid protein [Microvirus D_HF5_137]|nr:major capsid protein [Microvirus D_HF5_137]
MGLFKLPSPHPNLSRNGYDLSSRKVFSAPAGALLPIGVWECNPTEKFSFKVDDFVRTQPLNTAAFARCKEYYHFFFVPYRSLWNHSDKFFTGVTNGDRMYERPSFVDKLTANEGNFVPTSMPSFYLDELHRLLISQNKDLTSKLSAYSKDAKKVYKAGGANFVELLEKTKLDLSNLTLSSYDALGYEYAYGAFRLLHMLGYGIDDKGQVFHPYKQVLDKEPGDRSGLFDMESLDEVLSYFIPHNLANPFRLLGYQRIYNDFYRNQLWEKPVPYTFNVDWCNSSTKLQLKNTEVYQMCQLRYRHWTKDFYTGVYPTASYNEGIFNLPNYTNSKAEINKTNDGVSASAGAISTSDIRAMFALEKMLERTRAANGLDYSNQIAAHYGFKVPESRRDVAQFIGGVDNTIVINEVMSTANSSIDGTSKTGSVVGQVFGKGIGTMSSGRIDFEAKEHGMIFCIYSISPQVDYDARQFDPFNRKFKREDYFQPEFENLGYQPLVQSDVCFGGTPLDGTKYGNTILGYTPRYSEYKTSRDMLYNQFMTGGSLNAWTTPRNNYTNTKARLSVPDLLIDPNVLYPIFGLKYNGKSDTDQFLINSYFDVKAVRPMAVNNQSLV